jgi:Ca2+-binding EF-hand superfamily protein
MSDEDDASEHIDVPKSYYFSHMLEDEKNASPGLNALERKYKTKSVLDDLKAIFDKYDLNGDGCITKNELRKTLGRAKMLSAEKMDVMEDAFMGLNDDTDPLGHKGVTFDVFVRHYYRVELKEVIAKYVGDFESADVDGDRKVTKNELAMYISEVVGVDRSNSNFFDWWREMDVNKNNYVTLEEFAVWLNGFKEKEKLQGQGEEKSSN